MTENPFTSFDIIKHIAASNPAIAELNFISFGGYDLIQERIDSKGELKPVMEKALDIRARYKLPFWDSFNLSLFNHSFNDYGFLREIAFHNSMSKVFVVSRKDLEIFLAEQVTSDDYLTVSSKVSLTNGENAHLPLLDLHIPVSPDNERLSIEIIKALALQGDLVDSGKSYHFYGAQLINEEELITLLSKALLYSPIIDRAWIAHQLTERRCCLRISKKYSRLPFKVRGA